MKTVVLVFEGTAYIDVPGDLTDEEAINVALQLWEDEGLNNLKNVQANVIDNWVEDK